MRSLALALVAMLAACAPGQVQVATDLLTTPEARCREAQDIYDGLQNEGRATALDATYVVAACLR